MIAQFRRQFPINGGQRIAFTAVPWPIRRFLCRRNDSVPFAVNGRASTKISTRSTNRAHDVNFPAVVATETPVRTRARLSVARPHMAVVEMANETNRLANGRQVIIDEPFMTTSA
jgi:hypothetical protein